MQNDLQMKENSVNGLAVELFSEISRPLSEQSFDFIYKCFERFLNETNAEEDSRKIDYLKFLLKVK